LGGATTYDWIGWLILIVVFAVFEVLTVQLTFAVLAVGALAGLVGALLGAPWWLQLVIAALVALLLLFALRPPLLRRLRRSADPAKTGIEAIIGIAGRVTVAITEESGQVKLANGETWTAHLSPGSAPLAVGAEITVTGVNGAAVVVAQSGAAS
jgi:membrane protein implicated in regulation of membrane protease activity